MWCNGWWIYWMSLCFYAWIFRISNELHGYFSPSFAVSRTVVGGENMYAGVNLPSFHHAADGWGNIANCFVVCSSITKFGVMACQYDTASTTFPRWENYLRWKHKAAENWINISPKLLVLNWIALICLLRRLFVAALLLRRWQPGLWPIDRGLHIAEMYIRYALWLQPETMYLLCLRSCCTSQCHSQKV